MDDKSYNLFLSVLTYIPRISDTSKLIEGFIGQNFFAFIGTCGEKLREHKNFEFWKYVSQSPIYNFNPNQFEEVIKRAYNEKILIASGRGYRVDQDKAKTLIEKTEFSGEIHQRNIRKFSGELIRFMKRKPSKINWEKIEREIEKTQEMFEKMRNLTSEDLNQIIY